MPAEGLLPKSTLELAPLATTERPLHPLHFFIAGRTARDSCFELMIAKTVTMHKSFTGETPCPNMTSEMRTEKSWRDVMIHVKDNGPNTLMAL
mmetsp:Transcript_52942/g.147436  ORF Transcript_52942/g.147436 Transcript_52942/m.147436 type:complete len:93 (-) Transcript_52942:706-984(-)